MFPTVGDLLGVRLDLPTHEVFVALGVPAAALVFVLEARRRGTPTSGCSGSSWGRWSAVA